MRQPNTETFRCFYHLWTLFLFLGGIGCTERFIDNTSIEDTPQNREVVDFVDRYRRSVASRNISAMLSLVSRNYFDDMGTPIGDDDVDFVLLQEKLKHLRDNIQDARYQIRYRSVVYVDNRILVDIFYTGWFQVRTDLGLQWVRRIEPHRLVLINENGELKILSGM